MTAFYLLLAASLLLATVFVAGYVWASRTGQFDDTQTPSMRVLADDDVKGKPFEEGQRRT